MNKEQEAQAWLAFASAAVAGYETPDELDDTTNEGVADDICEMATLVADTMLLEFVERYGTKTRSKARGRRATEDDDE